MRDETTAINEIGDRTGDQPDGHLQALGELGPQLLGAHTLSEIIKSAIVATQSGLERPLVSGWLYDAATDTLQPCQTTVEATDRLGNPPVFARGSSIARRVYETGEVYATADVTRDSDVFDPDTPIRSELIVPFDGWGILIAGSMETREFETEDLLFATALQAMVSNSMGRVVRDEQSQELEARNQRLALLAEILSHDLQNPLMVAREYAVLARETGSEEYLARSDTAIERARTIIDGLVGLAITGQGPLTIADVSIESAAHGAWESTETGTATLTVDTDHVVRGDPQLIRQLLEQVFDNAVKHGPADVTVHIGTHGSGFYVEDNGPGIARGKREELLSDSTANSGTHVGFTIVRNVVTAHDWKLTLSGGESDGSRLEISTE
jgi:signal transduction histidine kinase